MIIAAARGPQVHEDERRLAQLGSCSHSGGVEAERLRRESLDDPLERVRRRRVEQPAKRLFKKPVRGLKIHIHSRHAATIGMMAGR